jgi:hypothetical protein
MSTFIITLIVIVAVIAIMAIGVICGRRPITGSCGGLALLGMACDCETPCPKKLAMMRDQAEVIEPSQADISLTENLVGENNGCNRYRQTDRIQSEEDQ